MQVKRSAAAFRRPCPARVLARRAAYGPPPWQEPYLGVALFAGAELGPQWWV